VLSAILGLVFVIGCGSSKEKQQMSTFMQQYSKTVTEYSDVVNTADKSKKAELEEILDSYKAKWTNMKIEMGSEITPQTLNTLDQEYQDITKKYSSLAGKS
jgi:outer membrane murein-binding lipoprotein Lpp